MASPRVLIALMPVLALVGGALVWGLRTYGTVPTGDVGSEPDEPDKTDTPKEPDEPAAPVAEPVRLAPQGRPGEMDFGREPRMRRLTGRVLGPDGAPVTGAVVSLRSTELDLAGIPRVGEERLRLEFVTTRTGPDGTFLLITDVGGVYVLIAEPPLPAGVPAGAARTVSMVCSAASDPVDLESAVAPKPISLRLRTPGRLEVRVVDERDRPLPLARVEVASGPAIPSAGNGLFARDDMVPGPCELTITSSVSDSTRARVEIAGAATTAIQVVLHCGVRVSGVVVDPVGAAVPLANVRVVAPRGADGEDKVLTITACDASGHFELGRLPEGPLRLHADGVGFDSLDEFTDVVGDAANVRVRGQWLGRAKLRLQTSDGKPLPTSVEVNVGIPGEPHPFEGDADVVDGAIVVAEFSGEDEQLVVDVPGYAALVRTVRAAPGQEVDLGIAILDAGHDLRGFVVTSEGAPVFQAAVRAAGNRAADFTARDGSFLLHRLPAGPVDLVVTAADYVTLSDLEVTVAVAQKEPLRLVLRRACGVKAKVENSEGKPAAGTRLAVLPRVDDPGQRSDPGERAFRTEDDGTFVLSLAAGAYRIQAEVGGGWVVLSELTLAEGEQHDLLLKLPTR